MPVIPLIRTYSAKGFALDTPYGKFQMSGTLDGFVDVAVPHGNTYPLTLEETRALAASLLQAADDVEKHCLGDRDALLSNN